MVLVEYVGDETKAKQFPHGNGKDPRKTYIRSQPHVLTDIRASGSAAVPVVYSDMQRAAAAANQPLSTAAPRDHEQIRNVRKVERNKHRLTHDAIYNLVEFAYDSEFVHDVHVFPDLWAIMYHPDMLKMFR